jgi:hypothetical protein
VVSHITRRAHASRAQPVDCFVGARQWDHAIPRTMKKVDAGRWGIGKRCDLDAVGSEPGKANHRGDGRCPLHPDTQRDHRSLGEACDGDVPWREVVHADALVDQLVDRVGCLIDTSGERSRKTCEWKPLVLCRMQAGASARLRRDNFCLGETLGPRSLVHEHVCCLTGIAVKKDNDTSWTTSVRRRSNEGEQR